MNRCSWCTWKTLLIVSKYEPFLCDPPVNSTPFTKPSFCRKLKGAKTNKEWANSAVAYSGRTRAKEKWHYGRQLPKHAPRGGAPRARRRGAGRRGRRRTGRTWRRRRRCRREASSWGDSNSIGTWEALPARLLSGLRFLSLDFDHTLYLSSPSHPPCFGACCRDFGVVGSSRRIYIYL